MAYTTIKKPSDYFNTNLYTGNNTETSHTGIGFQPDLTWLKVRNASGAHYLFDAIRGATNYIRSDNTAAEGTLAETLKSFDSDGYTVGTSNSVNTNNETMVGWNWLGANGTSANTDGSISSTVSANTTSGFSIVSYTGDGSSSSTVGHDLGVAPSVVIIKRRNASDAWYVMHTSLSSNNNVFLNLTDAQQNVSTYTGGLISTSPTSSVFSFVNGTSVNNVNASGGTYIAYCFAEKQGYSKFGSYTGNGNADGSFIYTGFKPAVFIVKKTSGTANWEIRDNKRTNSFNTQDERLFPNLSNAGNSSEGIDFISNGLKLRGTSSNWNDSGGTYSYMCFAEEPLVGDNPATAR